MIHSLPHRRIHIAATVALLSIVLASCGSYQQASYYDNDGIYSSNTQQVRVTEQRPRTQQVAPQQNNYGDYFGQRADEYGSILDNEVFTDVDGYYSNMENDSLETNQDLSYNGNYNDYNGYGSWGDNATSVNINIYDDWGWGGTPFVWGYGGFYGGFYGGHYGYHNPWRWNRYGYGWNNWGWGGYGYGHGWGGYGYGYGWGGYGYGYGGYYSPYFYSPYYSRNRFGNNYYNRNYAYNASRRGIYSPNSNLRSTALNGRSNISTANRTSTSRYRSTTGRSNVNSSGTTSRSNVGVDALERNKSYRTSRSTRAVPNYNNSSRSNQTYRSSNSSGTYKGTAPRTATYRSSGSSTTTRSSSGNYRSSSSSTPTKSSSSTYRSSSSSNSSSGSIRSSSSSSSRSSSSATRSSGRRN